MTQEDKNLLLQDLCARLPYGVIIHHNDYFDPKYPRPNQTLTIGLLAQYTKDIERWDVKPYLRPMSSMTDEEKNELYNIRPYFINSDNIVSGTQCNTFIQASECQDWLNAHHFDYRGLIEKGLALEAKEGMYRL